VHLHLDHAVALAGLAAAALYVEGETARLVAPLPGLDGAGEQFPDGGEQAGVGELEAVVLWGKWFGLYSVLVMLAGALVHWARHRFDQTPHHRVWLLMLLMGLIGTMWGMTTTLLQLAGAGIPLLSTASAIIAGVAGAALGFCASSWWVYASHLTLTVLTINIGYLLHGGALAHIFAIFSFVYMLSLLQFGKTVQATALGSINLRFENKGLVEQLQRQTQQAHEAREQAEAAKALAESHSHDKSRFLAAASHDLRQPIHALGLFLEALGTTPLNAKQRTIFENAMLACDASRSMLGTLLDFSRIDAGVVRFEPRNFSLQAILSELSQEYASQAEAKGLVFRLHDTIGAVYSDPALVSLIVRNLIANAVRYTNHGGILLGCRNRGEQLVIEVWDTGIGIAARDHERIFKEFLQVENPERDRTKGLGLGLAIVQGLCRVIGAHTSLHSVVGKGSVFRLALPRAQGAVVDAQGVDSLRLPSVQGLRVVVVDDEQAVRVSMEHLLTSWGCECSMASNLQEALRLPMPIPPQVLITDYRLQNAITGKEVINAMRQHWGEALFCIIVTGDTAPDRLRDAHETGAMLLHKPLSANQLLSALSTPFKQVSAEPTLSTALAIHSSS
jgi:signal transduction histidine kinase/ActR/RegA family two-component response regulator